MATAPIPQKKGFLARVLDFFDFGKEKRLKANQDKIATLEYQVDNLRAEFNEAIEDQDAQKAETIHQKLGAGRQNGLEAQLADKLEQKFKADMQQYAALDKPLVTLIKAKGAAEAEKKPFTDSDLQKALNKLSNLTNGQKVVLKQLFDQAKKISGLQHDDAHARTTQLRDLVSPEPDAKTKNAMGKAVFKEFASSLPHKTVAALQIKGLPPELNLNQVNMAATSPTSSSKSSSGVTSTSPDDVITRLGDKAQKAAERVKTPKHFVKPTPQPLKAMAAAKAPDGHRPIKIVRAPPRSH